MISIKVTRKEGAEFAGMELTEVIGPKPRAKGICFSDQDSAIKYLVRLLETPAEEVDPPA